MSNATYHFVNNTITKDGCPIFVCDVVEDIRSLQLQNKVLEAQNERLITAMKEAIFQMVVPRFSETAKEIIHNALVRENK